VNHAAENGNGKKQHGPSQVQPQQLANRPADACRTGERLIRERRFIQSAKAQESGGQKEEGHRDYIDSLDDSLGEGESHQRPCVDLYHQEGHEEFYYIQIGVIDSS